jgi:glutamine amidotransferase
MIAIINYGVGNIRSVQNALRQIGAEAELTDDTERIERAEKVILPGVGEAGTAMRNLREKNLDVVIPGLKQPVLGICLGLQLMCRYSEEGDTDCLGIFDTEVKAFPKLEVVPHMGWNDLQNARGNLFSEHWVPQDLYFVHSYAAALCNATTAVCDYIIPFSAALEKDNFYATQFHPEKSAQAGKQILQNFLNL